MHNEYEAAQWVARQANQHLVYSRNIGEWLEFDEKWQVIPHTDVLRFIATAFTEKIAELKSGIAGEKVLELIKLYNSYLSNARLNNVLSLLKVALEDKHPWDNELEVFPAANGLVDLRSGEVWDYVPDIRISKTSPISYNPDAKCPRWEQFLREITNDDTEKIQYLQRAVGYSLTGLLTEQVLFILFGSGANGKNIFLEVLYDVIGPLTLAYQTSFKILERAQGFTNPSGPSPHLAALRAKRFVMASESTEGSVFNDGIVKSLTGDGHITARQLHKEETVFQNTAKIWLACNNMPRVYDVTPGFWRRLHLINFDQTFTGDRRDFSLKPKLDRELEGILIWAIEGAKQWYNRGLAAPSSIANAVALYRDDSDPLAGFYDECCLIHPEVSASRTTLYNAYYAFAQKEPGRPISRNRFYDLLRGHGFRESRIATGRRFGGLCLKTEIHSFGLTAEDVVEAQLQH